MSWEKKCEQPKYARCPYRARPSRGPYPARTTRSPPAREVLTPEQLSACASVPCTARPSPTRVPFLLLCSTLICEHSLHGFLFSPPRPSCESSSLRTYPPHPRLLCIATDSSASLRQARATTPSLLLADSGAPSHSHPLPPAYPACTHGTPPPPRPLLLNTLPSPLARTRPARPFLAAMFCCFSPQHVLPLPPS